MDTTLDRRSSTIRKILIFSYLFLALFAASVIIGYSVFLSSIVPPLNLWEAGNWWCFMVLFCSCGIALLLSTCALFFICSVKDQIAVGWITNVGLTLAFFVVYLAGIGAAEWSQSKKGGPMEMTTFGHYVHNVCGNGTTAQPTGNQENLSETSGKFDQEKCAAVGRLRNGIFMMYIWVAVLLIVTIVTTTLRLSRIYVCKTRGNAQKCC